MSEHTKEPWELVPYGDGGVDWEYTKEPSQAGTFSEHWRKRWFKLHGSKANATPIGAF